MKVVPFILSLVVAHSVTVFGEEWNRFRGSNGTGISQAQGLPEAVEEKNRLWRAQVGKGWSSPIVFKDKVFLTAEVDKDNRGIVCLDLGSGEVLWTYKIPFQTYQQHKFNSFASATPFADQDRVYIQWATGEYIEALALTHDGKLAWHRKEITNYVPEHGSANSSVVEEGVMLIRSEHEGPGNKILGLNATTGETLWELPLSSSKNPYSTALVRETAQGKEFIIVNSVNGVFAVDVKKGQKRWEYNPGFKQRSVGSTALVNDQLFTTLGSGGGGKESAMLKLNGSKPEVAYEIKGALCYVPTPLVVNDRLYLLGDGGILRCLNFKSGEEIYSERLKGTSGNSTKYFSSPVYADGKIYCCSQTGDVVVLKEGGEFEVLSTTKLENQEKKAEPINSTPAIAAQKILIRSESELHCFGSKTGTLP